MQRVCSDTNARAGGNAGQTGDFEAAGWDDPGKTSGICQGETGSLFDCSGEIGERSSISIRILQDLLASTVISSRRQSVQNLSRVCRAVRDSLLRGSSHVPAKDGQDPRHPVCSCKHNVYDLRDSLFSRYASL